MSLPLTKQALLAEISQSRAAVVRDFRSLAAGMNFSEKLRLSVRNYSPFLIGSAAIGGFFFTRLFGKKKEAFPLSLRAKSSIFEKSLKTLRHGGTALAVCKFLFPILKPMITGYTKKKLYAMTLPR